MRDTSKLHPFLQAKVKQLQAECSEAGLKIGIGECVRTVAEQDALYAQGRTVSGKIVTNAKGTSYSSQHQWGVAFDFYRADNKGAFENKDKFFQKVGAIAQKIGLGWGGTWTSIVDLPHCYLPTWGSTTSRLKSSYGKPETFMKIWLSVGDKVACNTSVYVKTAPAKKAKYDELTDAMKKKVEKQSDGSAKFKKGQTTTISKMAYTDDGCVYAVTKAGYYLKLIDTDGKYKFNK